MKKTKHTQKLSLDRAKLRELTASDDMQRVAGGILPITKTREPTVRSCNNTDCCMLPPTF